MMMFVKRFWSDRSGTTAMEYGLLAAGVAIGVIAALATFGPGFGEILSAADAKIGEHAAQIH